MSVPSQGPEPITRLLVVSPPPQVPQLLYSPSTSESILLTELRPAQPPSESIVRRVEPQHPIESPKPSRADSELVPKVVPTPSHLITTWNYLSSVFHNSNDASALDAAYEALKDLEIDFYLPQLCLLLVHLPQTSQLLERLVLDRCTVSLHFALRCMFCLGVLGPQDPSTNVHLAERVENYRYACELAYIHGKRPTLESNASPIDITTMNNAEDDTNSHPDFNRTKDLRFKYMWSLKRFMKDLSETGNELANIPEASRGANLRSKISKLNLALSSSVLDASSARFVTGLFLPFSSSRDVHYTLLRIPEHESTILPSRNRVPFSLCFETLSLPSAPLMSDSNLTGYIERYAETMQEMIDSSKRTDSRSSSVESQPSSPSTSGELLLPNSIPNRSQTPPQTQRPKTIEALEIDSPVAHLKRILSVPQNVNSVRTKERWASKEARVRNHSIYGRYEGWKLRGAIVKYGSDGLQEQLALQLLEFFAHIFDSTPECRAKLITYGCIAVEGDASLIEPLMNAESIHQIKKNNNKMALNEYFVKKWDGPHSTAYIDAQRRFMLTSAGSSLVSYILQLKDRHNGNIMIDELGHIVHIDWGFLLWNTPGAIGFETAPFKLTSEMVSVLGGQGSTLYAEFKQAFHHAFMALRKNAEQIIDLVKIMFLCDTARVPCAAGGQDAINALRERFALHMNEQECQQHTESLISNSYDNWRTLNYDYFQYYTNGILS